MRWPDSIRARLMLGATAVLIAFVAGAGWAVQRAHEDSVRTARFAQLQSTVYLLLAGAELDARGALVMPPSFPEPRLSLPGSGLYANVVNVARHEQWQSPSTLGVGPPFMRDVDVGQWRSGIVSAGGTAQPAPGPLDPSRVATNFVLFKVERDRAAFLDALRARNVLMVDYPHGQVRAVAHYGVGAADIDTTIEAVRDALKDTLPRPLSPDPIGASA